MLNLQELVSKPLLIGDTKFSLLWANFKNNKCYQESVSAMMFLLNFQKGNQNLELEPRKRVKSVFVKKKRGINEDKIAILISCDRKGINTYK